MQILEVVESLLRNSALNLIANLLVPTYCDHKYSYIGGHIVKILQKYNVL